MPGYDVPDETVGRIVAYIDYLEQLAARNVATISSQALAEAAGVNAAQVRKDFSYLVPFRLGYFGTPGVGYEVKRLLFHLTQFVGVTQERRVILVGYGQLGSALARYRGFVARNFNIVAIVDSDPGKIGKRANNVVIAHVDALDEVVKETKAEIAILTTPAASAQATAERLVAAGVKAILNFAPVALSLPEGVAARQVDLSRELQLLAFRVGRPSEEGEPAKSQGATSGRVSE